MVRLRHVHKFKDRHGKVRHYLRAPGCKAVALPGEPGSPEFLTAYQQALAALKPAERPTAAPGSLDALAASYYASAAWRALSPASQATYRRIVERIRVKFGNAPVALLEPGHVERIRDAFAVNGPAAGNHVLRTMRALMKHAKAIGLRRDDPTRDIDRIQYRKRGFATWSEEDIAQYEARWPSGSKPRLALALLLYTAQRRGDVVKMGRQHVTPAGIAVRQEKTGARLTIPIHPALAAELAQVPADQLTFLLTAYGKPHTAAGFYQAFRDWCADAGVPVGLSPHGLRKAACRRLAEAGCTARQIMAVSGHKTLSEVERYTAAVDQEAMAAAALARIKPRT